MTTTIIIALCSLLLIGYLFDLSSSRTRIPSVILLFALGALVRRITDFAGLHLPDFSPILPILGTIGLVLIVLEGALELELNRSKFSIIKKSFIGSLFSMLASAFAIALLFHYVHHDPLRDSLINAIPFCIISSAIAIPSVRGLSPAIREFVIYESSLSDISGVLFFNFIALNATISLQSFTLFGWQFLLILAISFLASMALSFLLSRIEHHIKFFPIILLTILIYELSKLYNLPALIFILLFGLFINNFDKLLDWKWIQRLRPSEMKEEVKRFKELTVEATFIVRALFFILFGYLLKTNEILNPETIGWALIVVGIVLLFRLIQLKASQMPLHPLLFISPRGLITVLLFLSIAPGQRISLVNNSLLIQVILITAFIMMAGLITYKDKAVDHNET